VVLLYDYCVLIVWLLCEYCVIIAWVVCEYCVRYEGGGGYIIGIMIGRRSVYGGLQHMLYMRVSEYGVIMMWLLCEYCVSIVWLLYD